MPIKNRTQHKSKSSVYKRDIFDLDHNYYITLAAMPYRW